MSVSNSASPAPITCRRCGLINSSNAQTCDCGWRLNAPLGPRGETSRVFVLFGLLDLTLFILAAFAAWSLLPLGGIILLAIWPVWYILLVASLFLMLRKVTWLTLGAFRFGYHGRSNRRAVAHQRKATGEVVRIAACDEAIADFTLKRGNSCHPGKTET